MPLLNSSSLVVVINKVQKFHQKRILTFYTDFFYSTSYVLAVTPAGGAIALIWMINSLYSARKSASEKTPTARGTPVTGTFRTTLLLMSFFLFVLFVFQMQAAAKKSIF